MKVENTNIIKAIMYALTASAVAIGIAFSISSCTASRIVTTSQQVTNRNDTTIIMTTKTEEIYKGSRNN